jgi:hypothetical protein
LYDHQETARLVTIIVMMAILMSVLVFGKTAWGPIGIGLLFAMFFAACTAKIKGPSSWRETYFDISWNAQVLPHTVRAAALRLRAQLPETKFILGTLEQERVVLDPYLKAVYGSQQVVLGIWDGWDGDNIWDGHKLIACA